MAIVRTAAVLPVKRFARAKQRLGASVGERQRLALAPAMVGDVLAALSTVAALDAVVVVSAEEPVAQAAAGLGFEVVPDPAEEGQSAAALLGVARAFELEAERVVLLPGDCPALDPGELTELLASGRLADVVIVPDRHGTGTNALVLTPPDVIAPSFGPGSFERHRALAAAAGASCRVERPSSLLLDIDTGEDLQALRERLAAGASPERASRTRAALDAERGVAADLAPR